MKGTVKVIKRASALVKLLVRPYWCSIDEVRFRLFVAGCLIDSRTAGALIHDAAPTLNFNFVALSGAGALCLLNIREHHRYLMHNPTILQLFHSQCSLAPCIGKDGQNRRCYFEPSPASPSFVVEQHPEKEVPHFLQ